MVVIEPADGIGSPLSLASTRAGYRQNPGAWGGDWAGRFYVIAPILAPSTGVWKRRLFR